MSISINIWNVSHFEMLMVLIFQNNLYRSNDLCDCVNFRYLNFIYENWAHMDDDDGDGDDSGRGEVWANMNRQTGNTHQKFKYWLFATSVWRILFSFFILFQFFLLSTFDSGTKRKRRRKPSSIHGNRVTAWVVEQFNKKISDWVMREGQEGGGWRVIKKIKEKKINEWAIYYWKIYVEYFNATMPKAIASRCYQLYKHTYKYTITHTYKYLYSIANGKF